MTSADSSTSADLSWLRTFNESRSLLFSIAYRMVGSVADAEDIIQDAFIRWQQTSRTDIRSPKAFLVTIVTRLSINHLRSARSQREQYVGQWLPEPIVTDPGADPSGSFQSGESVSMAFLVLLERLTPVERAVFLLREVFEYEYTEIAEAIGRTEANCRQILRRAKEHVHAARTRFKTSDREHRDLLAQFVQATAEGDMDGLLALLANDVVLHTDGGGKAPALPNLIHGATNVSRAVLGASKKFGRLSRVMRLAQINGEPGLVTYVDGRPHSALVLHVAEGRVKGIYIVINPAKLTHLPPPPPPSSHLSQNRTAVGLHLREERDEG